MKRTRKLEITLPREQRPYEKCREKGEQALTNAELLAIVLRNGSRERSVLELAEEILKQYPEEGGLHALCDSSLEELMQFRGIGEVKAMQLKCVCELAKRLAREPAGPMPVFDTPARIAAYYMEDMRHRTQEELWVLFLNTRRAKISDLMISRGTVNAALITPREIYVEALKRQAVSIALVHNHPSGDPTPSEDDILFTRRVQKTGELAGIALLDHIIIGDCCFVSLRERGIVNDE